jgi:AraC-like DNA-binding protein
MAATDAPRERGAPGDGPIDESVLRGPAAELRPFIARYSGYRQAASWPDRFAVLDAVLSHRLAAYRDAKHEVSSEVRIAWQRLLSSGGTIGVSALAAETGWSEWHLRNRFAAEIGLTPKAAARVVRFDRARRLLQRRAASGLSLELAALAAHCGYYDQAHLDREFRSLAGAPPTTWLAREFRNLQANAVAAAGG